MKIGFDATTAFLDSHHSAYSKSVIHLLSQSSPENFYVLYTSTLSKDPSLQALLSPNRVEVRTPSFMVSKMGMGNIWRSTILGNTALADGIEILHGLHNELPYIINKKLKTVVTIHHLNFIRYPKFYNPIESEIIRRRVKHASKISDKIITPSKQTAEDLQSFMGVNPDKIEVIPQTCHPAFKKEYSPIELTRFCDQYNLPQDFLLVTTSAESIDNSALRTVKALAMLKDIDTPLVIAGKLAKAQLSEIKKITTTEKVLNKLIFLPDLATHELAKVFQLCKVFINASSYPGDAISIKNALFSKVPVICSRIPEFIEAGGLAPLYVHPQSDDELAYTIQNIINNPSLTGNMILQGEMQSQQFDDDVVARHLSNIYASILMSQKAAN